MIDESQLLADTDSTLHCMVKASAVINMQLLRRSSVSFLILDIHTTIRIISLLHVMSLARNIFAEDCLVGTETESLALNCTYNQCEGVLCDWDFKGNISDIRALTATLTIDGALQGQCTNISFGESCLFKVNSTSYTQRNRITLEVLANGSDRSYSICREETLLSIVKYRQPTNVSIVVEPQSGVVVIWDFPSDYPEEGTTERAFSECWVRWSEDFGPWEVTEGATGSLFFLGNFSAKCRSDVQATCVSMMANKENWSKNATVYVTETDLLELNCTYNRGEGVLCDWDFKGNISDLHLLTATFTIDRVLQGQCRDISFGKSCLFNVNSTSYTRLNQIILEVNVNGTDRSYSICREETLLSIVKYRQPTKVSMVGEPQNGMVVTWDFPSDYPEEGTTERVFSECRLRWSEDFGPWEVTEGTRGSSFSVGNVKAEFRLDVQVTCMSSLAIKENWSKNATVYVTGFSTPSVMSSDWTTVADITITSEAGVNEVALIGGIVPVFCLALVCVIAFCVLLTYRRRKASIPQFHDGEIADHPEGQEHCQSVSHAYSTEYLLKEGSEKHDRSKRITAV